MKKTDEKKKEIKEVLDAEMQADFDNLTKNISDAADAAAAYHKTPEGRKILLEARENRAKAISKSKP